MGRGGGGSRAKGGGGGGGAATSSNASAGAQGGGGGIGQKDLEKAFDASPGAKDNFVHLADFRDKLGGTRAQQDAAIRQGQLDGKFTLDPHEGLYNTKRYLENAARYKAAAIPNKHGKVFEYISRR